MPNQNALRGILFALKSLDASGIRAKNVLRYPRAHAPSDGGQAIGLNPTDRGKNGTKPIGRLDRYGFVTTS